MTPFGRRVVAIMGFTIGVCSVHLSAAPQGRVEVAGSAGFLDGGTGISGAKHITVGTAAGRRRGDSKQDFSGRRKRS